jgi:hypothetical protein
MLNTLSIDFESWVHHHDDTLGIPYVASTPESGRRRDNGYIPRVTRELISALKRYDQHITFFVVSDLYDWYPECIEEIAAAGHEIAWHTQTHRRLGSAQDLLDELKLSENFRARFRPEGFRAPFVYLPPGLHEILASHGFTYSSSSYDIDESQAFGGVREFPISSLKVRAGTMPFPKHLSFRLLSRRIPFGSGLMLPLLGSSIVPLIKFWNRRGMSAHLFVHPWQLYRPAAVTGTAFRLKALRAAPLGFPYQVNISALFEKLLAGLRFETFSELLRNETAGTK